MSQKEVLLSFTIFTFFVLISFLYNESYSQNVSNADLYFKIGKSLNDKGKYLEAIDYYDRSINANPSNATFYQYKASSLFKIERYQDSIDTLDIAILIDPTDFEYHYQKGDYLSLMNKNHEAIIEYDEAIKLNPNNTMIYIMKSFPLLDLGMNQSVIDNFNQAIAIDPSNKTLYSEKANFVSMFLQDHQEALKTYEKALSIWKTDDLIKLDKAFELEQINKTKAIEYYKHLLNSDPNNSNLNYKIGSVLYDLGNYNESLKFLDKAILLGPIKPEYFAEKGSILAHLHNYTLSMKNFNKAINMNPDESYFYREKYEALKVLGDNIEAVNAYDEWLSSLR